MAVLFIIADPTRYEETAISAVKCGRLEPGTIVCVNSFLSVRYTNTRRN